MTPHQKQLIVQLVEKYSEKIGTEYTIAFVAENNGMLVACQALLKNIDAEQSNTTEWLRFECAQRRVDYSSFLLEVRQVALLFKPRQNTEDHYSSLGLSEAASQEEIKLAYRRLSKQYHPDTADATQADNSEKFIEINKAYHALLEHKSTSTDTPASPEKPHWTQKKKRPVSDPQKKQFFKWSLALLAVLVVVSIIASNNFRKRAMLAGLQESKRSPKPASLDNTAVEPSPALITAEAGQQEEITVAESALKVNQIEPNEVKIEPQKNVQKERNLPPIKEPVAIAPPEPTIAEKIPESKPTPAPLLIKKETTLPRQLPVTSEKTDLKNKIEITGTPEKISTPVPVDPAPEPLPQIKATSVNNAITEQADSGPIIEAPPALPEKKQPLDLQSQVDNFLDGYINAYEQRNLILFARFFEADATENGVPFKDGMSEYSELFAKTSKISFQIEKQPYNYEGKSITIDGRFTIHLYYNNGNLFNGAGPIHFLLAQNQDELLIKEMQYTFD